MLDDDVKERLKVLTIEEVKEAVSAMRELSASATERQESISIEGEDWYKWLSALYPYIPSEVSPNEEINFRMDPLATSYIEIHNPVLFDAYVVKEIVLPNYTASVLYDCILRLRELADDIAHDSNFIPIEIDIMIRQFLGQLLPVHQIWNTIYKDTKIEEFVYFITKNVKRRHPRIYQQYQELCRAKTGDTPLLQAVKQTISHRYFSGNIGSFCPLYLADILNNPQFKAMSSHPKHQWILLDMIDLCNYLAGSRKGCSIETNGFHYTWSDCRIEISEDAFRCAVKDIVSRGWFKVISKKRLDDAPAVKMYVPSTDWKKKRLSDQEIARIQDCGEQKQKRIADSKKRYRRAGTEVECGIEHTFSDTNNTHS